MNLYLISLFDPTPIDEPIYPRFIGIANAATKRGHNVTHFTSTFRHTKKAHRFAGSRVEQINPNYNVVFTRSMGYRHNMMPRRFIAHNDYSKKLIKEFEKRNKPDAIFLSMPPLSLVREVSKWAKKHDIPVIADIIDPWPDSFIKDIPIFLKPVAKMALFPFYKALKQSFNRCSAITSISNGYLNWAKDFHNSDIPTAPFFLAIDFDDIQQNIAKFLAEADTKVDEKPLRLIYAGSLASSYDIPTILKAARYFDKNHPGKTKFVITGKGPQQKNVEQIKEKVKNLEYLGWISKDELLLQYGLADLGLIQHKNSLTQTITYKFFNYMSAGLPLLNSLQGEMADMIGKNELGFNNNEQNSEQLIQNILQYLKNEKLLGEHKKNVLEFTMQYGNSKSVYKSLVEFIEQTRENTAKYKYSFETKNERLTSRNPTVR
ncbi:MAG TPA: glycosyltransferase [Aequorivita sp.]|nr:glycosyltransferase [Aequorivita sp.]